MLGTALKVWSIEAVDKQSVWVLLGSLAGTVQTLERQQAPLDQQVSSDLPFLRITDLARVHQNKFSQVIRAEDEITL
eukprot:scaffold4529_cov121-Cylindrotheca_fusiformis.AAC.3